MGMDHELHIKKVLTVRTKLKPLTAQEMRMREQVRLEGKASEARGAPTLACLPACLIASLASRPAIGPAVGWSARF